MSVSIVRDRRFLEHLPSPDHPESPRRLQAIEDALRASPIEVVEVPARTAEEAEIRRVHTKEYLDLLLSRRGRSSWLDPDTATSPGSVDAALLAAGSTIELFSGVARGRYPPGLALVRPPGHHALPNRAMGFCLINNVAVGARSLLAERLAERIVIYDWDVHHGNGTQDIFYEDGCVLYLSTHQRPFYPGTGSHDERGRGPGEGATLNVPLPAGTGDAEILEVTDRMLAPKVREFRPDVILISAGYDPFEDDPIGGFRLTIRGFGELAKRWRALADDLCGGRIAGVLEGGYHLRGLAASVCATLESWDAPRARAAAQPS